MHNDAKQALDQLFRGEHIDIIHFLRRNKTAKAAEADPFCSDQEFLDYCTDNINTIETWAIRDIAYLVESIDLDVFLAHEGFNACLVEIIHAELSLNHSILLWLYLSKNTQENFQLLDKICGVLQHIIDTTQDAEALYWLGCIYASDFMPGDDSHGLARRYWEEASALDHPEAQNRLAEIYYQGVPSENEDEALRLWNESAEAGCTAAQHNLAQYYEKQTTLKANLLSKSWRQRATSQERIIPEIYDELLKMQERRAHAQQRNRYHEDFLPSYQNNTNHTLPLQPDENKKTANKPKKFNDRQASEVTRITLVINKLKKLAWFKSFATEIDDDGDTQLLTLISKKKGMKASGPLAVFSNSLDVIYWGLNQPENVVPLLNNLEPLLDYLDTVKAQASAQKLTLSSPLKLMRCITTFLRVKDDPATPVDYYRLLNFFLSELIDLAPLITRGSDCAKYKDCDEILSVIVQEALFIEQNFDFLQSYFTQLFKEKEHTLTANEITLYKKMLFNHFVDETITPPRKKLLIEGMKHPELVPAILHIGSLQKVSLKLNSLKNKPALLKTCIEENYIHGATLLFTNEVRLKKGSALSLFVNDIHEDSTLSTLAMMDWIAQFESELDHNLWIVSAEFKPQQMVLKSNINLAELSQRYFGPYLGIFPDENPNQMVIHITEYHQVTPKTIRKFINKLNQYAQQHQIVHEDSHDEPRVDISNALEQISREREILFSLHTAQEAKINDCFGHFFSLNELPQAEQIKLQTMRQEALNDINKTCTARETLIERLEENLINSSNINSLLSWETSQKDFVLEASALSRRMGKAIEKIQETYDQAQSRAQNKKKKKGKKPDNNNHKKGFSLEQIKRHREKLTAEQKENRLQKRYQDHVNSSHYYFMQHMQEVSIENTAPIRKMRECYDLMAIITQYDADLPYPKTLINEALLFLIMRFTHGLGKARKDHPEFAIPSIFEDNPENPYHDGADYQVRDYCVHYAGGFDFATDNALQNFAQHIVTQAQPLVEALSEEGVCPEDVPAIPFADNICEHLASLPQSNKKNAGENLTQIHHQLLGLQKYQQLAAEKRVQGEQYFHDPIFMAGLKARILLLGQALKRLAGGRYQQPHKAYLETRAAWQAFQTAIEALGSEAGLPEENPLMREIPLKEAEPVRVSLFEKCCFDVSHPFADHEEAAAGDIDQAHLVDSSYTHDELKWHDADLVFEHLDRIIDIVANQLLKLGIDVNADPRASDGASASGSSSSSSSGKRKHAGCGSSESKFFELNDNDAENEDNCSIKKRQYSLVGT